MTFPPFSKMTAAPSERAAAETVSFEPFPTVTVSAYEEEEADALLRRYEEAAAEPVLSEAVVTAGAEVRSPSTIRDEPEESVIFLSMKPKP